MKAKEVKERSLFTLDKGLKKKAIKLLKDKKKAAKNKPNFVIRDFSVSHKVNEYLKKLVANG